MDLEVSIHLILISVKNVVNLKDGNPREIKIFPVIGCQTMSPVTNLFSAIVIKKRSFIFGERKNYNNGNKNLYKM